MAAHFAQCVGVDISPTMVKLAAEFNSDLPECKFVVNEQECLCDFPDNAFRFIYTSIVLQHIAPKFAKKYIAELVRVLKPGGVLVFQLPDHLRASLMTQVRTKLAFRSRLQTLLGKNQQEMQMHCFRETQVKRLVESEGGR